MVILPCQWGMRNIFGELTLGGMKSIDLIDDQLNTIQDRLTLILDYVRRLHGQMKQQEFPPGDPLVVLTAKAGDALGALCLELASQLVERELGRPPGRSERQ